MMKKILCNITAVLTLAIMMVGCGSDDGIEAGIAYAEELEDYNVVEDGFLWTCWEVNSWDALRMLPKNKLELLASSGLFDDFDQNQMIEIANDFTRSTSDRKFMQWVDYINGKSSESPR